MPPRKRQKPSPGDGVAGRHESSDQPPLAAKKPKRAFRCQFCAKEFLRNEHLQRHERLRMNSTHSKELRLPYVRYQRETIWVLELPPNLYPEVSVLQDPRA